MSSGKKLYKMRKWSSKKGRFHSLEKLAAEEREANRKPRVKRNGIEL